MAQFIAIYGGCALVACTLAVIVALIKRRDPSFWGACSLLFPPMLLVLLFTAKNTGARPRRPAMDAGEPTDSGII